MLLHFEAVGFDGAPRFLGVDDQGREILSYVDGDAAFAPVPPGDDAIVALGQLLRRMHDAQAGFVRPLDARWQQFPGEPKDGDVICHNDLFWTNIIFNGAFPTALIDWDLATPGSRLSDVGYAASFWAPLRIYEEAEDWGLPTERRGERLRLLCDAYGLAAGQRADLLDDFMERRRLGYEAHRVWGGAERRPGWAEMWNGGSGRRILGNIAWVEGHRQELDTWLS